jgi:hypothetical protein
MNWPSAILAVTVVVGLAAGWGRIAYLHSQNDPSIQKLVYEARTQVRERLPGQTWGDWHRTYGGGPRLLIGEGEFEIVALQGMVLNSRHLRIQSHAASMWRTSSRGATTQDRIWVLAHGPRGYPIELKLDPVDGAAEAWEALAASHVSVLESAPGRGWADRELARWLFCGRQR